MAWNEDSSVDWILPGKLAVGNFIAAGDLEVLRDLKISAVIGLTPALKGKKPEELGLKSLHVYDLKDGAGNDTRLFRQIVDLALHVVQQGEALLIHCHAGRSRSVVAAAGVLMALEELEPDSALRRVTAHRDANVAAGLQSLLHGLD